MILGFLTYRIYRINRDISSSQQNMMERRVLPILYIAVDTAILYTILVIIAIIDVNSHSSDTLLVINIVSPFLSFHCNTTNESFRCFSRSSLRSQLYSIWS
jgi:uncharacterized membrane protein (DUF106 family)